VAVATIAPVVALTHVVALTRYTRWREEFSGRIKQLTGAMADSLDAETQQLSEMTDLLAWLEADRQERSPAKLTKREVEDVGELVQEYGARLESMRQTIGPR
jgi:hypothetical protein